MKIKHVLASLGLALTTAFGALVGLGLNKEAKAVKAEDPADTWMINISMDLRDIIEFDGFDPDSVWVQTYTDGVGNAKWFHMYPVRTGSMFYQVNASFPDDYSYDRMQFKFSQGGVEKWGTPNEATGSKDSYKIQTYCTFAETWTGDNWNCHFYTAVNLFVEYNDVAYNLVADIPSKRFIATNVVSDNSDYFTLYYRQGWGELSTVVTDHAKDVLGHVDAAWSYMPTGTYDVFLENNNNGNGVLDVIRHEAESETCIYYVLENDQVTNDYIYAWGGSEQFGAWPGTKITEIEDLSELTGNGVLHFEGSETPKLIYRIPVSIGYPTGDVYFKFNNNDDWESEQRALLAEHAYWYTGQANYDAAEAIEILNLFETYRNNAEDYSVCNISKDSAKYLVGLYTGTTDAIRDYIDRSSVWTYKRDGSEGNELVSYRLVVEELAKIAGVELEGSSRIHANFELDTNSATVAVVIIVAAVSSAVMLSLLFILKKKRK